MGYTCKDYASTEPKLKWLKGKCWGHTVVGKEEVCIQCACACQDEKACEERWKEHEQLKALIKQNPWLKSYINKFGM